MDIFSAALSVWVLLETVSEIDMGVVSRSVQNHNYLLGVCLPLCCVYAAMLVSMYFMMEPLRSRLPREVLSEARSGMIYLVTSSSCTYYALVVGIRCYT